MPDEEDDGHFGNDEPSTMVVGRDDVRHAELITAARGHQPEPAASTPVAKPSLREDSEVKVPGRSIAGTVDAADLRARPKFSLGLVVALFVAIAIVGFALYRYA